MIDTSLASAEKHEPAIRQAEPRSAIVETAYMAAMFAGITLILSRLPRSYPEVLLFGIAGAIPLFLSSKPTPRDLWLFLLLGSAFTIESLLWKRSVLTSLVFGFGFASVQILFFARRRREAGAVLPVALLFAVVMSFMAVPLVIISDHLTPHTIDATLHSIDFGIGDWLYRFAATHIAVGYFFHLVYVSLPLLIAIVISLEVPSERRRTGLLIFSASALAIPFYILFPAVGPVHVHEPLALRNCIPSMHLGWAILGCVYSRSPWLRNSMIVFAILTAIATLTTGEHYVIDLLAAIPFAYAFVSFTGRFRNSVEINRAAGLAASSWAGFR